MKERRKQDPRRYHYTNSQVRDTEGLFKLLKWIHGSFLKKGKPTKQSPYRCPRWGCRRSLQVNKVDTWIKVKESKSLEAITILIPRLGTPKVSSSH